MDLAGTAHSCCMREVAMPMVYRALKISHDPIRLCLDMLQLLSKEGVDPATSSRWERLDERYQFLTARKESFGKDVRLYRERYSKIISRKSAHPEVYHFNRYDNRPAIPTGLLVRVFR